MYFPYGMVDLYLSLQCSYSSCLICRHFPIGLLYDMANRLGSTPPQLPWCINVHSNNFPDTVILRNPGLETIQDMYMSMIKEVIAFPPFLLCLLTFHGMIRLTLYDTDRRRRSWIYQNKISPSFGRLFLQVAHLSPRFYGLISFSFLIERYDDYWHVNRHILDDRGAGLRSVPLRLYLPDHCPVIQDTTSFTDEQGKSSPPPP